MNLKESIGLIKYGKCILFTGSGFSLGAKNLCIKPEGGYSDFLKPADLSNKLAKQCDFEEPEAELGDVAQFFLDKHSKSQLIDFLIKEFTASSISEDHKLIGQLAWRRCYTTNYDEIFENAVHAAGSFSKTITLSTPVKDVHDTIKACIHINGAISRLTPDSLEEEFKLTTCSYNADSLHYSPWFEHFKDDLMNADAVFFIGFSGKYDLDIRRVFQQTRELKEKTFFIVYDKEKRSVIRGLNEFGNVETIGLHGFAEEIRKHPDALDKDAKRPVLNYLRCFQEIIDYDITPTGVPAAEVVGLLSRGEINNTLLSYSVRFPEKYKYVISRERIDFVLQKIKDGIRTFIVTSNLGNGKTIFLKELAANLHRSGYRPFFFVKERDFILDEVECISKMEKTPVFIFDGYADHIKLIQNVYKKLNGDYVLILSERTAKYETTYDFIEGIDNRSYEINIDRLSENEIKSLVKLLDSHGLWGETAGKHFDEKFNYISKRCHKRLSEFLLTKMEAAQIKNSYSLVLNSIREKKEFYHVLLYLLWCKFLGVDLELATMMESMAGDVMNNPVFKRNPAVKEMIDFSQEKITLTSSILAFHILSKQIQPTEFMDFYINVFDDLDRQSSNRSVRKILKEMMKHSNISKILNNNDLIIKIYDAISARHFCIGNPQFWLQNAIARMNSDDFVTASLHFKSAYSFAAQIDNYSTYQIDTHYARFLLQKAVKHGIGENEKPYDIFIEAHQKLKTRRKGDTFRYYIYRVAALYQPFWEKFKDSLSDREKVRFKDACCEILDMALDYINMENVAETNKEIVKKTVRVLNEIVK